MLDWNVFKAKFSNNPQFHFEWFCYLLFCRKYNKPYGIFRYTNQSAIETNPINDRGDIIGFQAKFYDTPLSTHKEDLLTMLKKAKRDYPEINKIYIFSNQEWGQNFSSKLEQATAPQAKLELESEASRLDIDLIWNTASFFQSEFVTLKCKDIIECFFAEQSFLDKVEELKIHTDNILKSISDEIVFKKTNINLSRTALNIANHNVIIISGVGGVGKTVAIKKIYQDIKNKQPFYIFKSTEFNLDRLVDFYPQLNIKKFIASFPSDNKKTIVIDSAEKILDLSNDQPVKEFIQLLLNNQWQIVFTTRDSYVDDLNYMIIDRLKLIPSHINIPKLDLEELSSFAKTYDFQLPEDQKITELLRIPFYLNQYLSNYSCDNKFLYVQFKDLLWNQTIKKSQVLREKYFIELAVQRAKEGDCLIKIENSDIIQSLVQDGIIYENNGKYLIAHDIYEEWALNKYIEQQYQHNNLTSNIFNNIGSSLPIRRAFRYWVSEKLLLDDKNFLNTIFDCLDNLNLEQYWKDEILTSLLLSDSAKEFFNYFDNEIIKKNELLIRICFILRIACKTYDTNILRNLGLEKLPKIAETLFTQPKGQGWQKFLHFIFNHRELVQSHAQHILPILQDWVLTNKEGVTTKLTGQIAIEYYRQIEINASYLEEKDHQEILLRILSNSATEIKTELTELANEIINNNIGNRNAPYFSFAKYLLTNMEAWPIIFVIPQETLKIAALFWLKKYKNDLIPFHHIDLNQELGITDEYSFKYFPASAFQTPIYCLLEIEFEKTLDFIVQFTNKVIDNYANLTEKSNNRIETITLLIEETKHLQYSSENLYLIYRGMSNFPYLLQSILMALEKFLLDYSKNGIDSERCNLILKKILIASNSVALTSIVSSIVNAYPDRTYPTAKILFQEKELFFLDITRFTKDCHYDSSINLIQAFTGRPKSLNSLYEDEREKSSQIIHRKNSHLEIVFQRYQLINQNNLTDKQFLDRQNELWAITDHYYDELIQHQNIKKNWPNILARLDLRKMDVSAQHHNDGQLMVSLQPKLSPEMKIEQEEKFLQYHEIYKYAELRLWSESKLQHNDNDNDKKYPNYEKNHLLVYEEMEDCIKNGFDTEHKKIINRSIPEKVAATLVKFYASSLSEEIKFECCKIILDRLWSTLSPDYYFSHGDGVDECFYVLPELFEHYSQQLINIKLLLILSLFNEQNINFGDFKNFPINTVLQIKEKFSKEAITIILGYLHFVPLYKDFKLAQDEQYKNLNQNSSIEQFFAKHSDFLNKVETDKFQLTNIQLLNELSINHQTTLFLMMSNQNNKFEQELSNSLIHSLLPLMLTWDDKIYNENIDEDEFFEKFANIILHLQDNNKIDEYITIILNQKNKNRHLNKLLEKFLSVQDRFNQYDNFWYIWDKLIPYIEDLISNKITVSNSNNIILSYFFDWYWKKEARNWHTFSVKNRRFFNLWSNTLPNRYIFIYVYTKLLNGIGHQDYFKDGLNWLINILKKNNNIYFVRDNDYKNKAICQLENYSRNYIYEYLNEIKKNKIMRDAILVIVNYLVEHGSVTGYLLREKIL